MCEVNIGLRCATGMRWKNKCFLGIRQALTSVLKILEIIANFEAMLSIDFLSCS